MPPRLARQVGSEYRCYLSVLTGFSSHTSGGPGGRESLPHFASQVKLLLKCRCNMTGGGINFFIYALPRKGYSKNPATVFAGYRKCGLSIKGTKKRSTRLQSAPFFRIKIQVAMPKWR